MNEDKKGCYIKHNSPFVLFTKYIFVHLIKPIINLKSNYYEVARKCMSFLG